MTNTPTRPIYDALKEAGCKMDSHESDLYVEDTETARNIIAQYELKAKPFRSNIDQGPWLELPFMFQPFWDKKAR